MENDYLMFKKFTSLEQALEIKNLLNEYGIESLVADNVPPVDITFSGSTLNNQVEIQIKESDFEKANEVLEKNADLLITQIDKDYYLFSFSNQELYEILLKSDEWSEIDYALAQRILKERGEVIDEQKLNNLKNKRLTDLSKPEGNQKTWIIAGYILAFLGGILGAVIGYFI